MISVQSDVKRNDTKEFYRGLIKTFNRILFIYSVFNIHTNTKKEYTLKWSNIEHLTKKVSNSN